MLRASAIPLLKNVKNSKNTAIILADVKFNRFNDLLHFVFDPIA
jgi:hypothetical protein